MYAASTDDGRVEVGHAADGNAAGASEDGASAEAPFLERVAATAPYLLARQTLDFDEGIDAQVSCLRMRRAGALFAAAHSHHVTLQHQGYLHDIYVQPAIEVHKLSLRHFAWCKVRMCHRCCRGE